MLLTRSLRTMTLMLIKFSFFCLSVFLWKHTGIVFTIFTIFLFSLRFLKVSHVEGSSLTTSLRYQDLLSFFVISEPLQD